MTFELSHTDHGSSARAGTLTTAHGVIHTPIFMPVGTAGSVKAVHQRELENDINAEIILGNTYHLYLRPGLELVAEAVDLPARARAAELVVTGVGSFDFSSGSGSVPYGVATLAAVAIRPCVAVAGRVLVGSREMRALGVESAYAVDELVGADRASADPAGSLAELAERVARTWSR